MSTPFDEGYDAALERVARRECPYDDDTPEYDEWHAGYDEAEADQMENGDD